MLWLRALSFLVGVQIPAVILLPILLARGGHPDPSHIVVDAIGWVFALAGVLGILWCDLEFVRRGLGTAAPYAPTHRLIAHGLYRWTRNPIYVSAVIAIAGEAILFRSGAVLAYAAAIWGGLTIFVRGVEEPSLRQRFGSEYDRYCRQVPRWIGRPDRKDRPPNGRAQEPL
jgi:protein-S-isoprenylcysteine O-methyltransferase Ste14